MVMLGFNLNLKNFKLKLQNYVTDVGAQKDLLLALEVFTIRTVTVGLLLPNEL